MSIDEKHKWKYRNLPDETKQLRTWLVHSVKKKAIFCLHCLIFGSPHTTRGIKSFAIDGYSDWHNVSRDVESHEKSEYHRNSEISLIRWNSGQMRIDKKIIEEHNYWVNHHRNVVSVVIDCIRYLTQEMMGFRNSENTKGKLFNLFSLLAKYNADAQVYLEKLKEYKAKGKRLRVNFLAYKSVMTLACIMRDMVIEIICRRISAGKYYSIILDSTQDSSKMEATVLLARYIEGFGDSLSVSPHPAAVERLLAIFTSKKTTGKVLAEKTLTILMENNLDPKNIIGQSYDGAGNMQGNMKGVKTLIERDCPMALYIWCHSHRFSLTIEKTVEIVKLCRQFFGTVEELYVFMSGHRRHGEFVEILKKSKKNRENLAFSKLRLKRVCTTRWSSKSAACATIATCYVELFECLNIIANDKTATKETTACALGLKMKISKLDFIALLKINVTIFNILSPATIMLQSKMIDFGSATTIIDTVVKKLKALRTDESWDQLRSEITEMATEYGIVDEEKRVIHRKRFFDEMNLDYYQPADKFEKLKVEVLYEMIDSLVVQIEERFNKNTLQILKDMQIFRHENLMKENYTTEAQSLCQYYNIDSDAIKRELEEFKVIYKSMEKDIDVSDLLPIPKVKKGRGEEIQLEQELEEKEEQLTDEDDADEEAENVEFFILRGFIKPFRLLAQLSSFSNLSVLYKILVSLAVTSCSAERALSKEKIIKCPMRSTMLDEWMSAMMILAAEKDVLDTISNCEIIDKLAEKSFAYEALIKK